MGDFLRQMFGGSETDASSSSTQTNYTDPSLSKLAPDLATTLKGMLTSFGPQIANSGNPTANATPTTQAGMSGNESNLINTIQGQVGPGTASAGYIKDTLGGKYLPGQPGGNPFLQAAITAAQRPTLDNLSETLSRTLPGRFTANGQLIQANTGDQGGSSAFDRAAGVATRGASQSIADIASKMSSDAYTTERGNQNVAAQLDQGQVDNTIKALQASALPRLIQQNGLDQGLALFQQQTSTLLDLLKTLGAVQAPTLAANSVSTSRGTSEKGIIPGLFPKGFSGGGG